MYLTTVIRLSGGEEDKRLLSSASTKGPSAKSRAFAVAFLKRQGGRESHLPQAACVCCATPCIRDPTSSESLRRKRHVSSSGKAKVGDFIAAVSDVARSLVRRLLCQPRTCLVPAWHDRCLVELRRESIGGAQC